MHSREIPRLLVFFPENNPKRSLSEISFQYTVSIPWSGRVFQLSAGPGFLFGDGRGSNLRSEGNRSSFLRTLSLPKAANTNYYNSQRISTICLSGEAQILFPLFRVSEFGASLYGNLNSQDSFWDVTGVLKIHVLDLAK